MINETLPGPITKPLDRTVGGLGQTLDQRNGINDSEAFFNEQTVCDLILKFQCNRDVLPWRKIVEEIMPLVDTIIRNYNFQQYDEIDALRAECATKLSKVLLNYDPAYGRCFTHFSVSFKNFLISYVQKLRNKAKLGTCAESAVLEQAGGEIYVPQDISEDFKARLYETASQFLDQNQVDALKYLVNFFLLEGFGTSKTKLCYTLVAAFNLTRDQGYVLYDYALITMRSVLYEYYMPHYTDVDILRMSRRWSILPELAELIGIESFTKLADTLGGATVTFPTPKDIAKLRTERNKLDRWEQEVSRAALDEAGTSSVSNEQGTFTIVLEDRP